MPTEAGGDFLPLQTDECRNLRHPYRKRERDRPARCDRRRSGP